MLLINFLPWSSEINISEVLLYNLVDQLIVYLTKIIFPDENLIDTRLPNLCFRKYVTVRNYSSVSKNPDKAKSRTKLARQH